MFLVLFFWQVPRHLRSRLLYGLVAINPAFPYRISARIACAFYRAKADLLATFRYDPIAARTVIMATIDPAAFIVVCRHEYQLSLLAVH